jgi:predicted phage tail component-like protein
LINQEFTFDDITSQAMGISIVRQSGGIFPVLYVAGRDIKEDYPTRALSPYFFRTQLQPLTLTLQFSCIDVDMDIAKMRQIASWLCQSEYKPFISADNPDKVYYIMATNQIDFMTNGMSEGYFEIQFRCQHPYALTVATTPIHDVTASYYSQYGTTFTINNEDNVHEYFYPIYELTLGATPTKVSIYNETLNELSEFQTLDGDEVVYVDNQKKYIVSSTGNYKYDDFNKQWLRLAQGNNTIIVNGYCYIEFLLQYPIWT